MKEFLENKEQRKSGTVGKLTRFKTVMTDTFCNKVRHFINVVARGNNLES